MHGLFVSRVNLGSEVNLGGSARYEWKPKKALHGVRTVRH